MQCVALQNREMRYALIMEEVARNMYTVMDERRKRKSKYTDPLTAHPARGTGGKQSGLIHRTRSIQVLVVDSWWRPHDPGVFSERSACNRVHLETNLATRFGACCRCGVCAVHVTCARRGLSVQADLADLGCARGEVTLTLPCPSSALPLPVLLDQLTRAACSTHQPTRLQPHRRPTGQSARRSSPLLLLRSTLARAQAAAACTSSSSRAQRGRPRASRSATAVT